MEGPGQGAGWEEQQRHYDRHTERQDKLTTGQVGQAVGGSTHRAGKHPGGEGGNCVG